MLSEAPLPSDFPFIKEKADLGSLQRDGKKPRPCANVKPPVTSGGSRVGLLPVGPLLMDAVGGERSPDVNREKARFMRLNCESFVFGMQNLCDFDSQQAMWRN